MSGNETYSFKKIYLVSGLLLLLVLIGIGIYQYDQYEKGQKNSAFDSEADKMKKNFESYSFSGDYYFELGEFELALDYYENALKNNPGNDSTMTKITICKDSLSN